MASPVAGTSPDWPDRSLQTRCRIAADPVGPTAEHELFAGPFLRKLGRFPSF